MNSAPNYREFHENCIWNVFSVMIDYENIYYITAVLRSIKTLMMHIEEAEELIEKMTESLRT